jgi:hypothetical protein
MAYFTDDEVKQIRDFLEHAPTKKLKDTVKNKFEQCQYDQIFKHSPNPDDLSFIRQCIKYKKLPAKKDLEI